MAPICISTTINYGSRPYWFINNSSLSAEGRRSGLEEPICGLHRHELGRGKLGASLIKTPINV